MEKQAPFDIVWEKQSQQRLNMLIQGNIPPSSMRFLSNADALSFSLVNKDGKKLYGWLTLRFNQKGKPDRLGILIGANKKMADNFYSKLTQPKEATFKDLLKNLKEEIHKTYSDKATHIAGNVVKSVLKKIYDRENMIDDFINGGR